ncbi:MAG: hypothetical protein HYZ75_09715 [Elusimicrobia bacterium]|nr:hypothetical protein [Elusimicrobiota bacterium]
MARLLAALLLLPADVWAAPGVVAAARASVAGVPVTAPLGALSVTATPTLVAAPSLAAPSLTPTLSAPRLVAAVLPAAAQAAAAPVMAAALPPAIPAAAHQPRMAPEPKAPAASSRGALGNLGAGIARTQGPRSLGTLMPLLSGFWAGNAVAAETPEPVGLPAGTDRPSLLQKAASMTTAAPAPAPVDLYDPKPLMPSGPLEGQPILTDARRSLTILDAAAAARYAPREGEVVAANFSHDRKFWVAKFPKDAIDRVIFQKWDFGEKRITWKLFGRTLLDFELFHLAHTEIRFTLKPGTAIELYSQEAGAGAEPVHRIADLISSVEAVGPKQAVFGLKGGSTGEFVAVRRFKSLAQDVAERIVDDGRVIHQWELALPEDRKQALFAAAILDSHEDAMQTPYNIFLHSCTTEAFRLLDSMMDYGKWAWAFWIFKHVPLFPEAYLWARGLLKPGSESRLPTLNDELKLTR